MNHVTKTFLRRSLVATCAMWLSFSAFAAGLGGIKVESALGQPLTAEIEVTGLQTEEFARVRARIASPEDYQTAKLIYLPLLRQVRVTGARRSDGTNVLKISSVTPIAIMAP